MLKGRRETLFDILTRAGIALTDSDRSRIQTCTDVAALDRSIDHAIVAKTVADVLS